MFNATCYMFQHTTGQCYENVFCVNSKVFITFIQTFEPVICLVI